VLSISASLPAMQEALNPRRRRKAGRPQEAIDGEGARNASEVAKTAIRSRAGSEDPQMLLAVRADENAETRVRSRTKPHFKWARHVALLAAIVVFFSTGLLVYWFYSYETKPLIYQNIKTFESETEAP
jgi:hypothetical protein